MSERSETDDLARWLAVCVAAYQAASPLGRVTVVAELDGGRLVRLSTRHQRDHPVNEATDEEPPAVVPLRRGE